MKKEQDITEMLEKLIADMEQVKKALSISTKSDEKLNMPLTSYRHRCNEALIRKARNDELRKKRDKKN